MQRTHNPEGLALSSANLFDSEHFIEVPGRTLASLANDVGHNHIDLLKFDIEGAEYEVVRGSTSCTRNQGARLSGRTTTRGTRAARRLIERLDERGFELIGMRPTLKLAFARRELLGAWTAVAGPTGGRAGVHHQGLPASCITSLLIRDPNEYGSLRCHERRISACLIVQNEHERPAGDARERRLLRRGDRRRWQLHRRHR